jgi:hydroxymethylbilane synthase
MKIRIGSRASKLAKIQAQSIGEALLKIQPDLTVSYHHITTKGDQDLNSPLSKIGGKGVFVKEIEDALLKNEIDVAVHSLKDLPQSLPYGLKLGPVPKREDPREAWVSRFGELLHELPKGSTIGTSSPRRKAQLLSKYQKRSFKIEDIRGNVDTRIKKLQDGHFDAILLAVAGLTRLGLQSEITQILEPNEIMPAPLQGCLGLEVRSEDTTTLNLLEKIKDETSDIMARAERSFLQALGGDCLIPIASWTVLENKEIKMEALLLNPDGSKQFQVKETGPIDSPELVGAKLAGLLLDQGQEILCNL